jgi:murein L,D-transpeptidase YcbB/YkuD
LEFSNTPDYENPTDSNTDNVYIVEVTASDGTHTDAQLVSVNVVKVASKPVGRSGKSHKGSSSKKVCKDTKAINFSNVGQHDPSLCKYAEEKKEEKKEQTQSKKEDTKEKTEKTQGQKEEVKPSGKCSVVKASKEFLRVGSKGEVVKALQEFLNANGFDSGKVDGIFGKITKAAVMRMQKAYGIVVDGIVGPQTKGKISC